MKINIQWQDQHGHWKHFQTKHNEADAYRTAKRRAESRDCNEPGDSQTSIAAVLMKPPPECP